MRAWSGSTVATASAGAALAAQPLLQPAASPFDPIVLAAAAALALALERVRRWWPAVAIAIGIAAGPLVMAWLPPETAGGGCAGTLLSRAHWRAWLDGSLTVLGSAGAFGAALALLGAFGIVSRGFTHGAEWSRRPVGLLGVYTVLPALWAYPDQSVFREFGTLLAAFWICVAAGLADVITACRRARHGWTAAALIAALLPMLQWPAVRSVSRPPDAYGVDRLSLQDVRRLLAVLPADSLLVEEDAATAALLRAAGNAAQRMGKRLRVVAAPGLEPALGAAPAVSAFALPRSARSLQWAGVALRDADLPGIEGVARPGAFFSCPPVRTRWTEIEWATARASSVLSITASEVRSEHGVLMYALFDAEPRVSVIEPEGLHRTGVHHELYRLSDAADGGRLAAAAAEDGLPPGILSFSPPGWVARIEIWRSPGLPRTIGVALGVAPVRIAVRATATEAREAACPAFPYRARPIRVRQ